MNNELREKIIKQAKEQGLKHTQHKHGAHTVDNYSGTLTVNVNGSDYVVRGRKSAQHGKMFTQGYCSIQRKTICTGLR